MKTLVKISRNILPFLFLFVVIHFLKDIAQDVLKIPTFLDLFGNINEDISIFPVATQFVFICTGYISFLAEIFLIIAIPLIMKKKKNVRLEKIVWITIMLLVVYFTAIVLLEKLQS